jgi:DNA-directed RNA polymerase subunit RPC12/RpoP
MAGAIGVAAALLARQLKTECPHCGHVQRVDRRPVPHRVCARCQQRFPVPAALDRRRAASRPADGARRR